MKPSRKAPPRNYSFIWKHELNVYIRDSIEQLLTWWLVWNLAHWKIPVIFIFIFPLVGRYFFLVLKCSKRGSPGSNNIYDRLLVLETYKEYKVVKTKTKTTYLINWVIAQHLGVAICAVKLIRNIPFQIDLSLTQIVNSRLQK